MAAVVIVALAIALVIVLVAGALLSDQHTGTDHPAQPDGTSSTDFDQQDGAHTHMQGMIVINPATGLPMVDDTEGVDVAGNPYGVDLHPHSAFGAGPFETGPTLGSSFDDWASSGYGHGGDASFSGYGTTGTGVGSPFD